MFQLYSDERTIYREYVQNALDSINKAIDTRVLNQAKDGVVNIDIDVKHKVIRIKDNGGIPIVKHKDAGVYVPEFIFGQLRTSSNYDDNDDRNIVGTNGLGSVLSNIFSKLYKLI